MPATPAWPPKSLPRLYVDAPLQEGEAVALDPAQANYLGSVLRLGLDAEVLVFDGRSGEWLARIADAGKKRMILAVERQTKALEQVPDLTLAFAPVKRAQVDWLVEKATELGVRRLQPVITHRTVVDRIKLERLAHIAVEAAEQCGRTLLPEIADPVALPAFLKTSTGILYFADETGGEPAASTFQLGPATILTGPEGGFTPQERDTIRALPHARAISLGPRILRAETAALAAVAAYMALAGDWR